MILVRGRDSRTRRNRRSFSLHILHLSHQKRQAAISFSLVSSLTAQVFLLRLKHRGSSSEHLRLEDLELIRRGTSWKSRRHLLDRLRTLSDENLSGRKRGSIGRRRLRIFSFTLKEESLLKTLSEGVEMILMMRNSRGRPKEELTEISRLGPNHASSLPTNHSISRFRRGT